MLLSGRGETHALVDDWGAHSVYLPMFLFGLLLYGSGEIWRAIRRYWRWSLIAAILAYAVVASIEIAYPGDTPVSDEVRGLFNLGRIVQAWCAVIALIGVADRFWNRDNGWRATLTEAVFPFYIIHQTIIVIVGWWLLRFGLPAWAEFAILVPATVLGCWIFYDMGRRIPLLRVLIGLKGIMPPNKLPVQTAATRRIQQSDAADATASHGTS